jgi:hypothetical protein
MNYTILPNTLIINHNSKVYNFNKNDIRYKPLMDAIKNKEDDDTFDRILNFKEVLEQNNIVLKEDGLYYKNKHFFSGDNKNILLEELLKNEFDLIAFCETLFMNNFDSSYTFRESINYILKQNRQYLMPFNFVKKDNRHLLFLYNEGFRGIDQIKQWKKDNILEVVFLPTFFGDLVQKNNYQTLYDYFCNLWGINNEFYFNSIIHSSVNKSEHFINFIFYGLFFNPNTNCGLLDSSNAFNQLAIKQYFDSDHYSNFVHNGVWTYDPISNSGSKSPPISKSIYHGGIKSVIKNAILDNTLQYNLHFNQALSQLLILKSRYNLNDLQIISIIFNNYNLRYIENILDTNDNEHLILKLTKEPHLF